MEELEVDSKSSEESTIPEGWKDENDTELEVDLVSRIEDGKEELEVEFPTMILLMTKLFLKAGKKRWRRRKQSLKWTYCPE